MALFKIKCPNCKKTFISATCNVPRQGQKIPVVHRTVDGDKFKVCWEGYIFWDVTESEVK